MIYAWQAYIIIGAFFAGKFARDMYAEYEDKLWFAVTLVVIGLFWLPIFAYLTYRNYKNGTGG